MDNDRRNEIMENLAHETEAPCTQEWRDELTAEELDFVAPAVRPVLPERLRHLLGHPGPGASAQAFPAPRPPGGGDRLGPLPRAAAGWASAAGPLEKHGGLRLDEIDGVC